MNWHKHIERKLSKVRMIKKERTQKTELRKEWKGNRNSIYKKGDLTGNRKTERVQTRLRGTIEKNRKSIEETIK